ncbi:myotrophin [Anaeramoeba ignava]|uniref:Myotrophin n=1 Tax=Anaeramoeba ignava TaxID=1746090 RepID=A0A9Q0LMB7_ANAIG|nr:myotrophin [Anaeramoeba ignava]
MTLNKKKGVIIEGQDEENMIQRPMFWNSNFEGESQVIPKLLNPTVARRVLIHSKSNTGDTGVHYCCLDPTPNIECLDVLISYRMNLNAKNNFGWTSLHIACLLGNHQFCERILATGADPDSVNNLGFSPIHYACRYGRVSCLKVLLKYNAKLNKFSDNESLMMLIYKDI